MNCLAENRDAKGRIRPLLNPIFAYFVFRPRFSLSKHREIEHHLDFRKMREETSWRRKMLFRKGKEYEKRNPTLKWCLFRLWNDLFSRWCSSSCLQCVSCPPRSTSSNVLLDYMRCSIEFELNMFKVLNANSMERCSLCWWLFVDEVHFEFENGNVKPFFRVPLTRDSIPVVYRCFFWLLLLLL